MLDQGETVDQDVEVIQIQEIMDPHKIWTVIKLILEVLEDMEVRSVVKLEDWVVHNLIHNQQQEQVLTSISFPSVIMSIQQVKSISMYLLKNENLEFHEKYNVYCILGQNLLFLYFLGYPMNLNSENCPKYPFCWWNPYSRLNNLVGNI